MPLPVPSRVAPRAAGALALALVAAPAWAKPVSFQDGMTLVLDYAPHVQEAQVFAAPHYRYSVGGGYLRVDPEDMAEHGHDAATTRDDAVGIAYLRLNVLAHRWNLRAAQANVFAWGGLGVADAEATRGATLLPNAGIQLDWETRRFYTALKTDWHAGFAYSHGSTVLQLGVAPYLHDYAGLATWIVAQGQVMDGEAHDAAGGALLVRIFWRWLWVEAGADDDGRGVGLVMLNF